ncbi:hypothetical protein [Hymenobacter sp. YC55]|uniref:hypothetical protein n=1 Tax=Hymenobacter sp. YC55 TaxID=3034019 RepID=UPI0023F95A57|nr:hypothetical protein [Hymenobacter sp. YC55]MDF7813322.1 hypothetical protein [Hymenobacter sp. YC55]
MKIRLMIGLVGLLLSSAPVLAQSDKNAASITPTTLPGEENLSVQERAERDFLMPVRRKQAAALKHVAEQEAAATQTATEMLAHTPELTEETKVPEVLAAPKAAATRRTYHRSSSRSHASRKKTVHRSSGSKSKSTAKRRSTRRR